VRFTCVGPSKVTSIKSVGGGTIMRTGGCTRGVIYGASFTRTTRLDPSRITLTVDPGTIWQIQAWQGKYIQHTGVPADTANPIPVASA